MSWITTPTTVSLWRGRFARQRLDGLEDLPRSGTPPIYGEATDKRIRAVLERPPPKGFARWNGPLIAKALATSTCSTSRVPCANRDRSRRSQELVREQRSEVRQQGCRCGRPLHGAADNAVVIGVEREAVDPGAGARAGLSEAAERDAR